MTGNKNSFCFVQFDGLIAIQCGGKYLVNFQTTPLWPISIMIMIGKSRLSSVLHVGRSNIEYISEIHQIPFALMYCSVVKSFWVFAQSLTIWLGHSLQMFKTIWLPKLTLWINTIWQGFALQWVSDEFYLLQQPPVLQMEVDYTSWYIKSSA